MLRLLPAMVLLVLGACSSSLSPLDITVLDGSTLAPISGAKVIADTPSFNHPFSVASVLGQTDAMSATAWTDSRGRVRLDYRSGHPVRIAVLARERPIFVENIGAPWRGPIELGGPESPTVPSALRVRVEPASP